MESNYILVIFWPLKALCIINAELGISIHRSLYATDAESLVCFLDSMQASENSDALVVNQDGVAECLGNRSEHKETKHEEQTLEHLRCEKETEEERKERLQTQEEGGISRHGWKNESY